jgi:hypothetical protein
LAKTEGCVIHFCWSDWTSAVRQRPQGQGTTLGRLEHFARAESGFVQPGNQRGLAGLDGAGPSPAKPVSAGRIPVSGPDQGIFLRRGEGKNLSDQENRRIVNTLMMPLQRVGANAAETKQGIDVIEQG